MDETYPKSRRIRKRREYDLSFEQGRRIVGRFVIAFVCKGGEDSRFGTVVSKKWGCAVRRNRIKRLMRESFRKARPFFPFALNIVLLPKNMPDDVKMNDIMEDLNAILKRYREREN